MNTRHVDEILEMVKDAGGLGRKKVEQVRLKAVHAVGDYHRMATAVARAEERQKTAERALAEYKARDFVQENEQLVSEIRVLEGNSKRRRNRMEHQRLRILALEDRLEEATLQIDGWKRRWEKATGQDADIDSDRKGSQQ